MIEKIEEKGDGLAFHNAVKLSKYKAPDLYKSMNISSPTFYRLFKQEIIDENMKKVAARALNRTVEDIFGEVNATKLGGEHDKQGEIDIPNNNNNPNKQEEKNDIKNEENILPSFNQKKGGNEMDRLLTIMHLQAVALNKDAEARLLTAKTNDRLTAMLERREMEGFTAKKENVEA